MSSMFNKDTKKSCAWCKFGRLSKFNDDIFCTKRGVTGKFDVCDKYKYDVLKRIPDTAPDTKGYSADDFKLD